MILVYHTRLYRNSNVLYSSKKHIRRVSPLLEFKLLSSLSPTTTPARSLMARSGARRVTVEVWGAVGARMMAVDIHTIVFNVRAS